MVSGVYSDDNSLQLDATTQFRKLLSIGAGNVIYLKLFVFVKLLPTLLMCSLFREKSSH